VPTTQSLAPASGTGISQIFAASYADVFGYQDINQAMLMVAADASGVSGCAMMWARNGNGLYLANDMANQWLGPVGLGGSGTLQNSQCVLDAATSSASGSGNNLTVRFSVTFKVGFLGSKGTFLLVYGSGGNSGWQSAGTWTPTPAAPPAVVSVTPGSGSGPSVVFTANYSDSLGFQDIAQAVFMVAGNPSGVLGCAAMWDRAQNNFYLANDAATVWIGPVAAGGGGTLRNSQCVLSAATSLGTGSNANLTVQFGLTFLSGITGAQKVYGLVYGSSGNSGWKQTGTWTVTH
jgi:hypothetical protein